MCPSPHTLDGKKGWEKVQLSCLLSAFLARADPIWWGVGLVELRIWRFLYASCLFLFSLSEGREGKERRGGEYAAQVLFTWCHGHIYACPHPHKHTLWMSTY